MAQCLADTYMGSEKEKKRIISYKVKLLQNLDSKIAASEWGTNTMWGSKKQGYIVKVLCGKWWTDIMKNRKTQHRAKNDNFKFLMVE